MVTRLAQLMTNLVQDAKAKLHTSVTVGGWLHRTHSEKVKK